MWAAMNGMNNSLKAMLYINPMINRKDEDKNKSTALHLAAMKNFPGTVELLIKNGWFIEVC